ncbi:hypothetical protein POUND7_001074 [Theobroma cacao]
MPMLRCNIPASLVRAPYQRETKGCFPCFGRQKELHYTGEQLKAIFRRFDSDGDGRLGKQDLRNAFNILCSRLPRYRAFEALRGADENGDGYVEIDGK